MANVRSIGICPIDALEAARAALGAIDPSWGGTFTVPLIEVDAADEDEPIAWLCNWQLSEAELALVTAATEPLGVTWHDGTSPDSQASVLASIDRRRRPDPDA